MVSSGIIAPEQTRITLNSNVYEEEDQGHDPCLFVQHPTTNRGFPDRIYDLCIVRLVFPQNSFDGLCERLRDYQYRLRRIAEIERTLLFRSEPASACWCLD